MQDDPQKLPPLDLLSTFEAAARQLSFTLAARELFLTQSAVSRQVALLEAHLGVALFKRRHRALDLTDEGRRLHEAVRGVLAQLRRVVAEIRAPRRREVVALTTTPGLASLWLIPRLSAFLAAHPGVDVRIDATLERRQLGGEGFDIAVRYGPVLGGEGTPLFEESMQPVCAPALLRSAARPLKHARDLRAHTLLQTGSPLGVGMPMEWQSWLQAVGLPELEPAAVLTFNNYDGVVAAALAGQGVALGRRPLVDTLLRARKLVAPFKGATASARGYFLVGEPEAMTRPAVAALAGWLLEQARTLPR